MELTLKRLLEQAEFTQAKRGYDRDEVDDFLDRAVAMATKVEAKLTQTMEQARTAGEAAPPGPSDAEVEAEVARRVEARLAEERVAAPAAPAAPAGPSEEEQAEEMRRTLVLAQRTADAAIREARDEAERVRADAAAAAERQRSDLERELAGNRDAANERIRQEIAELEGVREALRADVGVLERHVEEQRNQLRSSLGELQRLLEDPTGFRLAPTPALLDPEVPAYEAPAPAAETPPAAEPAPAEPAPVVIPAEPAPAATPEPVEATPAADAEPEPAPAVVIEDQPEAQGGLSFGDVEHEPPSAPAGPPTEAMPITGDPFMDELRKAMSDDEPLGPRDDRPTGGAGGGEVYGDDDRRGWRFGKRR